MVHINSVKKNAAILVGAAALSAVSGVNAAAIPAGQGQGSAAVLDIEASVLRLPDAMPQRAFALPEHAYAKREWRGRKGKRGPWRNDHATDLIKLDLGNGPHDHQGSLLNIETKPVRHHARHHDEVVVIDHDRHDHGRHGHHGHGDVVEVLHKRRHNDHDDVIVIDGHGRHRGGRHHDYDYIHGHGHSHGDRIEVIGKRRHDDDVVIVDGGRHRHHDDVVVIDGGRHGHGRHGDYGNVHSHIHAHGDNVVINEKRRHRDDTVVVAGGRHSDLTVVDGHGHRGSTVVAGSRHGTTIVEGGRHGTTVIDSGRHRHGDVTVVGRDVHDLEARRHDHDDVIIVDEHEHGHSDRHSHRRPVTVVTRDQTSRTEVGIDNNGGDVVVGEDKHEPTVHVGKRHSSKTNVIVTDATRGYYDDRYYRYPSDSVLLDRPEYYSYGRGDRYGRVRVIEDDRRTRYRGGRWKRSHSDDDRHDRDDRHDHDRDDRHGGHGGRHCRHGHCHDEDDITVVTKRDNSLEMGGAPGYIDVTSSVFNSTTPQRIASLVLSTTNGTESDSSFVLNASNNIRTQVYLVPTNATSPATTASTGSTAGAPLKVNLKLPIFVAQSATVEPYCATFDPAPTTPGPLFVTKCLEGEQDANSSQVFLYDPATGIIHPDWKPSPAAQAVLAAVPDDVEDGEDMTAQSAGDDQSLDAESVEAEGAAAPSSFAAAAAKSSTNPTPSGTASSPPAIETSGTKSSTDSTAVDSKASNVTLVFTPVNPTLNQANVALDDDLPADEGDMSAQSESADPADDARAEGSEPVSTMDARDYGFPYTEDDAYYNRSGYDARYDAPAPSRSSVYEGEGGEYVPYEPYEPYGRYPEQEPESYEQQQHGGADWTAPYDWRWTKSADSTTAPSAEATFA